MWHLWPLKKKQINFFLVFFVCIISCGGGVPARSNLRPLTVQTDQGQYTFQAEVADTEALREQGYMYRTDLTDASAMLFIWDTDTAGSFWMQNTPTSLDIIFVNSSKTVGYMATDAEPYSTDLITPLEPYRYVLEVKAGFAARAHLQLGDQLAF